MKKIILMTLVAFSMFAANAQTKKSSKKYKKPTKEAVAKARFNKAEAQKKLMRDSLIIGLKYNDSLRLAADSVADFQKDSMSLAYKAQGIMAIDSTNKIMYSNIITTRDNTDKMERSQLEINKAAKLSDYQSKQVKYINDTYNLKAKALTDNNMAVQNAAQLAALNEERRTKIRIIVGKGREKKLESERKEFVKKNGATSEMAWIDAAGSVAVK